MRMVALTGDKALYERAAPFLDVMGKVGGSFSFLWYALIYTFTQACPLAYIWLRPPGTSRGVIESIDTYRMSCHEYEHVKVSVSEPTRGSSWAQWWLWQLVIAMLMVPFFVIYYHKVRMALCHSRFILHMFNMDLDTVFVNVEFVSRFIKILQG